jgi:hypothetical protein
MKTAKDIMRHAARETIDDVDTAGFFVGFRPEFDAASQFIDLTATVRDGKFSC